MCLWFVWKWGTNAKLSSSCGHISSKQVWWSSRFWGYHQIKPFGGPRLLGGFKLASFAFQIFRIESKKESTELFSREHGVWHCQSWRSKKAKSGQVRPSPGGLRSLRKFGWILGSDFNQDTLWLCQNSYWTWLFIVDLPIQNGDFP
jgi:hypothetical protein